MKLRNYLTILLSVLAIICLLFLAGFMTLYITGSQNPVLQSMMRLLPLDAPAAGPVTETEALPQQTEAATVKAHSFLFVGDSRTIGMGEAVNDSCTYVGAEGEGYYWLSSDGVSAIKQELEADPTRVVVFNFGVNDPKNVNLYIDLYHALEEEYPDASFHQLSVNPLIDSKNFNTTNQMIALFNATVQSSFPSSYIDSCSYLTTTGFETVDGLHYTDETYKKIHDFAVKKIAEEL